MFPARYFCCSPASQIGPFENNLQRGESPIRAVLEGGPGTSQGRSPEGLRHSYENTNHRMDELRHPELSRDVRPSYIELRRGNSQHG